MAFSITNSITISGMAVAVPQNIVTLDSRASYFNVETIELFKRKYGVQSVHVARPEQTASDLGYIAASQIIEKKQVDPQEIGAIVFVSLTPDYRSPATAAVLHYRLGLSIDCLAFDLILGCNGFINGIQAVNSLLANINRPYAMLIVGDTPSKQLSESNPLSMLYGDAAAAILMEKKTNSATIAVETFSDGNGFKSIIIPGGGFRFNNPLEEFQGNFFRSFLAFNELNINEQDYFGFVLSELPLSLKRFLSKLKANFSDFDFIAIQQAGVALINQLSEVLGFAPESLPTNIFAYGNTRGSSIPLLLCDKFGLSDNPITIRVLAAAFGEGFSWGLADFCITTTNILPVIETNDFFCEGEVSHNF
jgi:3-oxoacyl-[acyl-carrier-protein] synthase-3